MICDFRCPKAERVPAPYPLYAVHCSCNTTILGRTEEEARAAWCRHVQKKNEEAAM